MKPCLRTLATAIMLAVMVLGAYQPAAHASFDGGITIVIADGPGQEVIPAIDGPLVAYMNETSDPSVADQEFEIRYQDLTSGEDESIPGGEGRDFHPDVSGDTIVFRRTFDDRLSVMTFDVESEAVTELNPRTGTVRGWPRVGGSTVAWEDQGTVSDQFGSKEMTVHNLDTGETERLTDDALTDQFPEVSPDGSLIVWEKCEAGGTNTYRDNCEIWQASLNGTDWIISQLTGADDGGMEPDTDSETIVYQSNREGEIDIFWRSAGGGPEQRLELDGAQFRPAISGGLISFESIRPGGGVEDTDVLVYDIANDAVYPITDTPDARESFSDISVDDDGVARVAYESWVAGNRDIHAYVFDTQDADPTDTTPPTLTLPGDLTVNAEGPDGATVTFDAPAQDDVDPSPDVACNPMSESLFPIGTTTVSCTATDDAGNQAEGSFEVTVVGAKQQIEALVQDVRDAEIPRVSKLVVIVPLGLAQWTADLPNPALSCASLRAAGELVDRLQPSRISAEDASWILADIQRIRTVLGC